jgi:hypothetical protein
MVTWMMLGVALSGIAIVVRGGLCVAGDQTRQEEEAARQRHRDGPVQASLENADAPNRLTRITP